MSNKHRLIAINLPQFHPFKENDEWWGKGFTEWTNVTKAQPRFKGHYQPHLPADTGFYDLRLPEARQMQADMAQEYGIYGFCYYHYWFNGNRLMERPVNEILSSGKPDFPFMLCWANENWSRNWDGGFQKVLMEQNYSHEDDVAHMEYLCSEVFNDSRYIRVNGKPFFVVYRPDLFSNITETLKTWRNVAERYGLELYIGFMRSFTMDYADVMNCGFDVHVDFQPGTYSGVHPSLYGDWFERFKYWLNYNWHSKILREYPRYNECVRDYREYFESQLAKPLPQYPEFPCVSPSWDNSSRRVGKKFWALINNTPQLYGEWLSRVLKRFTPYSADENFVFINAWNEWAEGNHLEPDQKWGKAFLQETKKVIDEENG